MQHSIPKFPAVVKQGYDYLEGELWYGQHAFCLSLSRGALDAIAGVMQYANPFVYQHALPDASLPNVAAVVAGKNVASGVATKTVDAGWATLTMLGKSTAAHVDMLDALVAPTFQTTALGQSWLNSGGPIGGYCPATGEDALDILAVSLPPDDMHVTYNDHSKWAVAQKASSSWWCGMDNNHVASQLKRSGLAVCLQHLPMATLLRSSAPQVGTCGAPPPPPGPTPGPAPGPKPSSCCYYDSSSCATGITCCSSSGVSYQSQYSCDRYGAKHGCVWHFDDSQCIVEP